MVDWKRLERQVDKAIGRAFGEAVRFSPMKNGVIDASRTVQEIHGILHAPNADGTVSFGNGMLMSVASSESALVIQRADYPSLVIRQDDRIRTTTEAGALVWYNIAKVSDRFPSIVVMHLAPI